MLTSTANVTSLPAARGPWVVQRSAVTGAPATSLQDLLHATGSELQAEAAAAGFTVPVWRARHGVVLLHEGAAAEAVHVVRSGSFKCVKTSEDGYEQVLSFAGPGEVLGFEAISRHQHTASVIALEDSTVFTLPLRELDRWRHRFPSLDQALQFALSLQLARSADVAEMMAAVAAETRLARFLVWLSASMAERGQSPRRLYLRMSRRDIASLLGVAHETVSRSFSALADWGCLRVDNREVEILDEPALRACTRGTRGTADDGSRHGTTVRMRAAIRGNPVAA